MNVREYKDVVPLIGIPLERAISHAATVYPWLIQLAGQGWAFVQTGYGRTDVQRNAMVEHLLQNAPFTHLIMLDLDHDHPPEIILQLCESVTEDGRRKALSGLAFRRGEPYEPIAFRQDDEGQYYAVTDWEPGAVFEVDQLSTSCCIVGREVFQRIPWPWFKYTYPERGAYPTEDIWFCQQLTEYGIEMFVDTRIKTTHLRTGHVDEEVFRAYLATVKQELIATGQWAGDSFTPKNTGV